MQKVPHMRIPLLAPSSEACRCACRIMVPLESTFLWGSVNEADLSWRAEYCLQGQASMWNTSRWLTRCKLNAKPKSEWLHWLRMQDRCFLFSMMSNLLQHLHCSLCLQCLWVSKAQRCGEAYFSFSVLSTFSSSTLVAAGQSARVMPRRA